MKATNTTAMLLGFSIKHKLFGHPIMHSSLVGRQTSCTEHSSARYAAKPICRCWHIAIHTYPQTHIVTHIDKDRDKHRMAIVCPKVTRIDEVSTTFVWEPAW